MKMNMTRVQAMMQHPDPKPMLNLSMQASRDLAQTLQACCVKSIRLASVETMGGSELKPVETTFFDGVPYEITKWVAPAVDGIASFMSAFGISSISFEADRKDLAELRRSWSYIVNDRSQLEQVNAAGEAVPQGVEDPDVGDDPGPPGPDGSVGPLSRVTDEKPLPGMPFGDPDGVGDADQTPKESDRAEGGFEVVEI